MRCTFLVLLALIASCGPSTTPIDVTATDRCRDVCLDKIYSAQDLSLGPCLSNKIVDDWVCDVAHKPREEVDDNPSNQCSAFREGKAHHFVELDTECNVINVV